MKHHIAHEGALAPTGDPYISYAHGGDLLVGLQFMKNTISKNTEGAADVYWRQIPQIEFGFSDDLGDECWTFRYRFWAAK